MKLISWNVNGIRSVIQKGFMDWFSEESPDILCLQETKISHGQITLDLPEYHQYFNYADKKGYSGTAILSRIKPLDVSYGIGDDEHDHEGRIITAEYADFFLVCAYVPNSQRELVRLKYRQKWNLAFEEYLINLDAKKPVIMCGDLNVAHEEIDIKNPKTNTHNAGFTNEERNDFSRLLSHGFIDSFRFKHPDSVTYSWWSYMFKARERNTGWRIDYFVVSKRMKDLIIDAKIQTNILGSDHCPIELDTETKSY